jgi:hypothetical protein
VATRKEFDPDSRVDFLWDWEAWLDGDTIASFEFITPDEITKDQESSTATTVTGWFTFSGDPGPYEVVNRITTTAGRVEDWTLELKVRDR